MRSQKCLLVSTCGLTLNSESGFREMDRGGLRGRGRGGGWHHRGTLRGGGAPPVFQAKKWVKPGPDAARGSAGPEAVEGGIPVDRAPHAVGTTCAAPSVSGCTPHADVGGVLAGADKFVAEPTPLPSRKWVKGEGAIPAGRSPGHAPVPAPSAALERGKLSICVSNLDMSVSEDHLWKFFNQAARVASVKAMPKKQGKPYKIAFVNFADGTPKARCRETLKKLDGSAPSWNHGVAIQIEEQEERDARERKPVKRESAEEREARLAKLRQEFPWLPIADPAALIRRWGERESKESLRRGMTEEQRRERLFGSAPTKVGSGVDFDSANEKRPRGESGASDSDDGGGEGSRRKRVATGAGGGRGGPDAASSSEAEPCESEDDETRLEREATDDGRVGLRMMERMGWVQGGRGLGKQREGVETAIVPKAHHGRRGLGAAELRRGPAGIPRRR
jgi:hypothetical protein